MVSDCAHVATCTSGSGLEADRSTGCRRTPSAVSFIPGQLGTPSAAAEDALELSFLHLLSAGVTGVNHRAQFYVVLGMDTWGLCMLGRCSTVTSASAPVFVFKIKNLGVCVCVYVQLPLESRCVDSPGSWSYSKLPSAALETKLGSSVRAVCAPNL